MRFDPFDLLRRITPPEGWDDATDLDADTTAASILDQVLTDTGRVIPLDAARRRRRLGTAGIFTATALVAGGAVAALWDRSPDETRRLACYSEAAAEPAFIVSLEWDGQGDPVALCATAWSEGRFPSPEPTDELRTCVTDQGLAAVVPGGPGVCEQLGLAGFDTPVAATETAAITAATRDLAAYFSTTNCVPLADAEGEIARVLQRHGLGEWTIKIVDTSSDDEACATASIDPEEMTVVVTPVPRSS